MRTMMEGALHHHQQPPVRSPSSDGDSGSDDDGSNSVLRRRRLMYPIPPSHWFPRPISFRAFAPRVATRHQGVANAPRLHIQVTRPLAYKLTKDIVGTYQSCNPTFAFSSELNPKRSLTQPSAGVFNNGMDNERHDLVLYVNQVLVNDDGTRRYVVKDMVGSGTFGQVAKCYTEETNDFVAVKVIKNQPAYYTQAKFEIGILHMLNKEWDPLDKYHIIRSLDHFKYHGHLCIVFELLMVNLYEMLKMNHLKGISLKLVKVFTKQLLESLSLLREARVIHCDLKPENILLARSFPGAEIKLIDFGSACKEDQTVYTYIQSRFYRSPEVLLGHPYSTAIDMWSLGCVAAELFLGLPLFPGACEYDLLLFLKEKLGSQPPDYILRNAKYTSKFFKLLTAAPHSDQIHTAYQLLTADEFEARHGKKPEIGRRYIDGSLPEMIMGYHMKPMPQHEQEKELLVRETFVDFLRGLIECDPRKRWTPQQAAQHPFITEEPYYGPFTPVPETPRTPVHQGLLMEHRGIAGHWFCAGLSPQVGNLSLGSRFNGSPQQLQTHYSLASSLGSMGSFGSYGDGSAFDGNFESYVDGQGIYAAGLNGQVSHLGGSPESSWRGRPPPLASLQGVAHTQLGMSPSSGGGFRSLTLGASPSQYPGQGPLFQMSPGSYVASPGSFPSSPASSYMPSPISPSQQGSPNRFAPTSPARAPNGLRETAVGNANAAHGHVYRRRQWQGQVPAPQPGPLQSDFALRPRLPHSNANGNVDASAGYIEGQGGPRRGAPPVPYSRSVRNSGAAVAAAAVQLPRASNSYAPGTLGACLSSDSSLDGADEDSVIGPHWDPNFSDEFLKEDAQEAGGASRITGGVGPESRMGGEGGPQGGLGPSFTGPCGVVEATLGVGCTNAFPHGSTSDGATLFRMPLGPVSTSTSVEGSPVSSHSSSQSGYPRQKLGYYSPNQTSPSRLGPQCAPPSLQQQRHLQQGHHHHPHPQHLTQQMSPDQTPLHPHYGNRRHLPGEASTSGPPGTFPFQQRQQTFQLQQQQQQQQQQLQHQYQQQHYLAPQPAPDLQLAGLGRNGEAGASSHGGLLPSPQRDSRIAYFGVTHNTLAGNAGASRMQTGQSEADGNVLSAAGFTMAAGLGHPLHAVQHQQFTGGEALHHQWPGPSGILPQGPYFVNDLFNMGRRPGPYLVGVRPPTAPARK